MRPFVLMVWNFIQITELSWSTKTTPLKPALCASSDVLPCCFGFSCSVEVREQRDEHQAVQLFSPPVLAPEFHGCLHLVAAICWGERYAVRSSELLVRYPGEKRELRSVSPGTCREKWCVLTNSIRGLYHGRRAVMACPGLVTWCPEWVQGEQGYAVCAQPQLSSNTLWNSGSKVLSGLKSFFPSYSLEL